MGYILAYVQGITADEDIDDIYCRKLYQDYLTDTDDDKDDTYTLEECKKNGGLSSVSNRYPEKSQKILEL